MILIVSFCFLELLFTFPSQNYFSLFLLRITFYFLFYLCPIPSVYSNQQSTAFATIVSEALFRLCRGTNINTLLGRDRISGHVPRLFILYIFSYLFFVDSYIAGARETQEDTL